MLKRIFDFIFSFISMIVIFPFLVVFLFLACIDTNSLGFFCQRRVGQYGKSFIIFKLRSMHCKTRNISNYGAFIRKYKIDEIPQFLNVLFGTMSIVGPRPDIEGYYDYLIGENRKILELKPGLTSTATLKYRNEEMLLKQQKNPLKYNDEVIFPDKVQLNLSYYYNQTFLGDLKIIFKTFLVAING